MGRIKTDTKTAAICLQCIGFCFTYLHIVPPLLLRIREIPDAILRPDPC